MFQKKGICNIKATRKRKSTAAVANSSSKIKFNDGSSDATKLEMKSKDKNKKPSNCKSFNLPNDVEFDKELKNKATVAEPLGNFSSKIEICNRISNVIEQKNSTDGNKLTENLKIFEENPQNTTVQSLRSNTTDTQKIEKLLDDFSSKMKSFIAVELENKTNDVDFVEEYPITGQSSSNMFNFQSLPSYNPIVSQKKRPNTKDTRKEMAIAEELVDEFFSKMISSRAVELENETNDFFPHTEISYQDTSALEADNNEKSSNFMSSFSLMEDITKTDNSDQITDQLSISSPRMSIKSIIKNVQDLQIHSRIHIYSIAPEGNGLSAVDVSENLSHLAYSFPHSCKIQIRSHNSLSSTIARNDFKSTWLNFNSARKQISRIGKSEEQTECLSSPQHYIFSHKDEVTGLRFFSNDDYLLSCSLDGSVKVISTTTYQVSEVYNGCGSLVDIDVNNCATQFVTASYCNPDHVVRLYDFENKKPVAEFYGHTDSLKSVRFQPDGLCVATAAADNCIKLWSLKEVKEVGNFRDEENDHPKKIAFSPDGKYIASTHSGCVNIWDINTQRKIKCLKTLFSENCNFNICYNDAGTMLAAGGLDREIHVWNIISGESSKMAPDYHLVKCDFLGKRIFSIKYASDFFSCVTN